MVEWFVKNDQGYLSWLVGNPDGFVINTGIHARAGYVLLHRARCRTINRPLPEGRSWRTQYGKACATTADDLVRWADQTTGEGPASCKRCDSMGSAIQPRPSGRWRPPKLARLSVKVAPAARFELATKRLTATGLLPGFVLAIALPRPIESHGGSHEWPSL